MAITNPKDIAGLLFWYSAQSQFADGTANGSLVSQLTDLSGASNHALATGNIYMNSTGSSSSGPAFEWQGTSETGGPYFTLPNLYSGIAAGEVAYWLKPRVGPNSYNGLHLFGNGGNLGSHHPYQGRIYEAFLSSSRYDFAPPTDVFSWHRYDVNSTAGAQRAYFNNALAGSGAGGYQAVTAPLFGQTYSGSSYLGLMSCMVGYSRVLSDTERGDLDTWLVANPSGGVVAAVPDPETYLDLLPNGTTLVNVQSSPVAGSRRVTLKREPPAAEVGKLWLDTDV